jgi:hypothetical protein
MTNLRTLIFITAFATMFTTQLATADESNYQRLSLKEGISIEVPRHWLVHSDAEKKNFAAAGEASTRGAGNNYDTEEDSSRLLAVSALPMPSSAKIRITVVRPLRFTGADLMAATAKDLKESQAELATEMSQAMKATGGQLLDLKVPRVETIGGQSALLIEYRRTDLRTPSPWTVRRYRIPVGDKLIEFTTSYRESDAPIFKPILDHTKHSLRF